MPNFLLFSRCAALLFLFLLQTAAHAQIACNTDNNFFVDSGLLSQLDTSIPPNLTSICNLSGSFNAMGYYAGNGLLYAQRTESGQRRAFSIAVDLDTNTCVETDLGPIQSSSPSGDVVGNEYVYQSGTTLYRYALEPTFQFIGTIELSRSVEPDFVYSVVQDRLFFFVNEGGTRRVAQSPTDPFGTAGPIPVTTIAGSDLPVSQVGASFLADGDTRIFGFQNATNGSGFVINTDGTGVQSFTINEQIEGIDAASCTGTSGGPPQSVLTIDKQATLNDTNASGSGDVGETIDYQIDVENTGDVILTDVSLTDDLLTTLNCSVTLPTTLIVGESFSCTGSLTIDQADIDTGGPLINMATATATGAFNLPLEVMDMASVPLAPQNPAATVIKAASVSAFGGPGETVAYQFSVENTGNVTLSGLALADPLLGTLSCTPALSTLVPGASTTCNGSYITTQMDVDIGFVQNTATLSGSAPTGAFEVDSNTVIVDGPTQLPNISVAKSASPTSYSGPGESIQYIVTVTNTGNVTVGNINVVEGLVGAVLTCPSNFSLAPSEQEVCTAELTTTQTDVDVGSITNTASASGQAPSGMQVSDSSVEVIVSGPTPAPGIGLQKIPDQSSFTEVGDVISFFLIATNTGNVTLTGTTISDPQLGALVCTPNQPVSLAPGATLNCSGSFSITQAEIDAGSLSNTATASGQPPAGGPVSDDQTVEVAGPAPAPALTVSKSVMPTSFSTVDEMLSFTIEVLNSGNVTVNAIDVQDNLPGAVLSCPSGFSLAPDSVQSCTASYAVTQADFDAGEVRNTASADGVDPNDTPVFDQSDELVVPGAGGNAALSVVKVANDSAFAGVGEELTYAIEVANVGTQTVTAVTVSDSLPTASVVCSPAAPFDLAPTATASCTASYVTTQADLDAGEVRNVASATGSDPAMGLVSDSSDEVVVPAVNQLVELEVLKFANRTGFSAVGDIIEYRIEVVNVGNVTIADATLVDPRLDVPAVCNPAAPFTLAPLAAAVCTGSTRATQEDLDAGQISNQATVNGTAANQQVNQPSNTVVVPASAVVGALEVSKDSDTDSYAAIGDIIEYRFVVQNIGNVTLNDVTLSDPLLDSEPACQPALPRSLAPTEQVACTGTRTVTEADLFAGVVTNVATAVGQTPGGTAVSAVSDAVTVGRGGTPLPEPMVIPVNSRWMLLLLGLALLLMGIWHTRWSHEQ